MRTQAWDVDAVGNFEGVTTDGSLESRGLTLLIVEHDMPFIAGLCEHVVVLNFGVKIAEGTPAQIREHPAVLEAYLGQEDA